MLHSLITVIGNVASGKSTLAEFLAPNLQAHLVQADELYKTNPFFKSAVVDRSRWSLASDIWFLIKRVEMAKKLAQTLKTKPVVQDSGLLMSWVYANSRLLGGHMNRDELDLYNILSQELQRGLPKENLVIILDLPIKLLMKRIQERERQFEIKYFTVTYLKRLELSLIKLMENLKKAKIPTLTYTQHNWLDVVDNKEDQKNLIEEVKTSLKYL